jgi:hypothetical protein
MLTPCHHGMLLGFALGLGLGGSGLEAITCSNISLAPSQTGVGQRGQLPFAIAGLIRLFMLSGLKDWLDRRISLLDSGLAVLHASYLLIVCSPVGLWQGTLHN